MCVCGYLLFLSHSSKQVNTSLAEAFFCILMHSTVVEGGGNFQIGKGGWKQWVRAVGEQQVSLTTASSLTKHSSSSFVKASSKSSLQQARKVPLSLKTGWKAFLRVLQLPGSFEDFGVWFGNGDNGATDSRMFNEVWLSQDCCSNTSVHKAALC